jgi:hypothetical protein
MRGPGTANLTSNGQLDVYIQKMDTAGDFLWARSFGGSSSDQGYSIFVDDRDNVFATGSFQGTVDFDPGPGTVNLTSSGFDDVFILKMDANGNFLWVRSFGNNENGISYSIAVDQSGNVLTTGYFRGTVDFDPGPGTANLTANINDDVFVHKLDSLGNFIWARAFGSTGQDGSRSVSVDALGNVYTSGSFQGTVDFDPGPGTSNLTSIGGRDAFVHKMDPQGNLLWVSSFGGTSSTSALSTAIDHSGNVITTGSFAGTADFDPGPGTANLSTTGATDSDAFVQKMDSIGNYIWARSFIGIDAMEGHSINVDSSNNIYTTGYFRQTADFDPGVNTSNLTSNGSYDAFLQKMDSSGQFAWAVSFGSSGFDQAYSSGLDYAGNVYTAGYFIGTADFDPGTGINNLTSAGSNDAFLQKLSQCFPNAGTDIVSACDSYTWIDGNTYSTSNNTAIFTLTNAAGCDSVVTLDLTILNTTSGTDVQTACDSYTWIDGNTYSTSNNTATYTLTNAAGCDSVVTLNLTINNSNTGSETITSCDSYTWPANGNTYNSTGTYTTTLTNVAGCDSVVTLNLTINNSNTGSETITSCDNYTWPANGNTYNSTGTYTTTLTNIAGCDSVVTLNLTINTVSDVTTAVSGITISANNTNASYIWLDCDNGYSVIAGETNQSYTPSANGNYAVELTENGCADTSACVTITSVGIIENTFNEGVTLYPNPTDGLFSIEFKSSQENITLSIMDASGKLIGTNNYNQVGLIEYELDQPKGIYLIEVSDGENQRSLIRLIKQ